MSEEELITGKNEIIRTCSTKTKRIHFGKENDDNISELWSQVQLFLEVQNLSI